MGIILVPMTFPDLCKKDSTMQLGALVFNASKARDFYHNKLADFRATQSRAYAYEAEYLLTAQKLWAQHFDPNKYQKKVMTEYPEGLVSLPNEYRYPLVPFPYRTNL